MGVRVRYTRTELSEGVVETFSNADRFVVHDNNTIELRQATESGKYRVMGYIHPDRWESVLIVDEETT